MRTWKAYAAVLAWLTVSTANSATPPTTLIQDSLFKADGTRFDGMAQIEWKSFRAADGSEVPQNSITVQIAGGFLRVALVPTTNAYTPVFYTVRFSANGRTQFVENWSVPASSVVLRLADVRTHAPIPGPITDPPLSVAIQDVSGLRTELDLRPARGSNWMNSRTAVIGNSGALEGAIGSSGDCVHVDGTSGPCGDGGLIFVDADTPSGTIDGVNTAFTLSAVPVPATSLSLFRNGILLRQGVEYTISEKTVNLTPGKAPTPGDSMQAWYRVANDATVTINVVDLEGPQWRD